MIDDAGDKGVGKCLPTHAANYVSSSNGCCVGSEEENLDAIKGHFSRKHWARSTTEAPVKIRGLLEPLVALIDQGSEINVTSGDVYRKGGWPIYTSHGWRVRMATTSTGDLFGAVPNIPVMIGDVQVEQHFFVQEKCSYPIILGEPYITAVRMETKVLDDVSAYARIKSQDGKRVVQFLTVHLNHCRNRDSLRDYSARCKKVNGISPKNHCKLGV